MAHVPTAVATPPLHNKLIRSGCREVASGKVRHLYDVPAELMHYGVPEEIPSKSGVRLMYTTNRLSAYDHVLNGLVDHKGAVLNCLPIWWSLQPGFPCQHHLAGYGYDTMRQLFGQYFTPTELMDLAAQACLIHPHEPLSAEAVARGYLTGSGLRDYLKNNRLSMYGHPLPNDLKDGSDLGDAIWTPSTKATEGHDITITHAELQQLLGADVADQMRDKSLELYRWSRSIAKKAGLIQADTKYEWALLPDGTMVLIDEWNTTDSSRYWDYDEWRVAIAAAKTPPSHDKEGSRLWCQQHEHPWGIGIDKLNPADPEHAQYMLNLIIADAPGGQEMLDATSERYLELFSRLTGLNLEQFCIETLGIPLAA